MKGTRLSKITKNSFVSGIIYLITSIGFYFYFAETTSYKFKDLFNSTFENIFEVFVLITIGLFIIAILGYGIKTYLSKAETDN